MIYCRIKNKIYKCFLEQENINIKKNSSKNNLGKELIFLKFDNDFKEIKIRHIIIMFLLVFFISIVIVMVISAKGEFNNTDTNKLSLFIEILLVVMMLFKLRLSKKSVKLLYEDLKNNLDMKEIAWVILFITCLEIGSSNILTDIAYIISPSFANWFVNDSSMVINSMTDYWIVFIMGVFLAPFTEEIIFRKALFKRLSKKFNIYVGLIVSSIIFSSINFGSQMIGMFLLGIVNCMLYVKYENLLMPMLVYFINNIISMILFILFGEFGNNTIVLTSNDMILYVVSGGILFISGMIFFVKFINKNKIYLREMHDKSKVVEIN